MIQQEKKKKWELRKTYDPELNNPEKDRIISEIAAQFNIPVLCAELIYNRGCGSVADAAAFIHNNYISGRDPFRLTDMDKAVERINRAICSGDEKIAIFGDYDVDGVTSVSVLFLYLRSRGVNVGYYIPKRSDGYGMSKASIEMLHSRGVSLIITVDTGTTSIDEIAYANTLGMDTVVTDHHECRQELPPAIALVNPHREGDGYPFKELAGVGVTYKLISALEMDRADREKRDRFEAERSVLIRYCDLVAIGTVADVMPVIDENRMIISYGLKKISASPRKGIAALIDASSKKKDQEREITSSYIGFTIAPRLNAAGRMDNASIAVDLLLSESDEMAREIAQQLCEINVSRQQEENRIANEASEKIENDSSFYDASVIVLDDDNWRQGVIGIVASRLTEKYAKPTILVTFEGMQTPGLPSPLDVGKGSGRSVKGMNLVSALSYCEDLLVRYGGHELAAGLSVTRGNLPEFRRLLNEYARSQFGDTDFTVTLEADMEVSPDQITLDLAENIQRIIEPCGTGNPVPVFIMREARVVSVRPISDGKHTKFLIEKDGVRFQAIFFGMSSASVPYDPDDTVDLMFTLSINRYMGETSVQLILSDICYAQSFFRGRLNDRRRVRDILGGGEFGASENFLPGRGDFVNMYSIINDLIIGGRDSFSDQYIMNLIKHRLSGTDRINYVKYKLILAILAEMDILKISQYPCIPDSQADEWVLPQDYVSVVKVYHPVKVDLEGSELLGSLRRQCRENM